jgi:hypothetical protein
VLQPWLATAEAIARTSSRDLAHPTPSTQSARKLRLFFRPWPWPWPWPTSARVPTSAPRQPGRCTRRPAEPAATDRQGVQRPK